MARSIIIREEGASPPSTDASSPPAPFGLEDGLLTAGVLFAEVAAVVIWWPSALILAAVFCFLAVFFIVRMKSAEGKTPKKHGTAHP